MVQNGKVKQRKGGKEKQKKKKKLQPGHIFLYGQEDTQKSRVMTND